MLPRFSQRYQPNVFKTGHHSRAKIPCIRRSLKGRAEREDFVRWINVRHPFSRLLSAWRQKFDKSYSGVDQYLKYVEKIKLIKASEPDEDHVASFDGFLSYTANVANDEFYNEHWKS